MNKQKFWSAWAQGLSTVYLELPIEHSLRQSAAQRQNILRAAFAGQLVPQDPADEPPACCWSASVPSGPHKTPPNRHADASPRCSPMRDEQYWVSLANELRAQPKETGWLEFKHNNAEPQEIGEYLRPGQHRRAGRQSTRLLAVGRG